MADEEKKSFIEEFKEFVARGNAMTLAVGIIIGGAFTAIVNSMVGDVLMPIIGAIMGGIDFSGLAITVGEGEHAARIAYGAFVQAMVDFICISFVVFLIVKAVNKIHPEEEETPRTCPFCKQEIADDAIKCPHCTSELIAD